MDIEPLDPWLSHRARPSDAVVDTVVLHATGGSTASGAIETLRERGLSYHFIIEPDGHIYKCCPASARASHAGNSYGPHEQANGVSRSQDSGSNFRDGCSVNSYTIGISFVNRDTGTDPYEAAQVDAAAQLVESLKTQFPALKWITTHKIVSPGRKTDPAGFDIDAFGSRVGLRVWRYGAR